MDQYDETSNGTTMTARRFAEALRKRGHEVRVLTASKVREKGVYTLPEYRLPIFAPLVLKQGMKIADIDESVMREAIKGSDVVHLLLPFRAESAAADIAREMGIATTAAFHIQPENITYSIGLGHSKLLSSLIYRYFQHKLYNKIEYIHCPSEMIKSMLISRGYKSNICAISNGVSGAFARKTVVRPSRYEGKFVILSVGRYSSEKRQDLIIKAIGKSKYNKNIQLVLAGKGPTEKKLKKLSDKYLYNPAEFVFLPEDGLVELINSSDLYVHASDIESEAISCIEAFSCGLVPVISDSRDSATKQFAVSELNLFHKGDAEELKNRIEWFIEHPEEKRELSDKYVEFAAEFSLDASVDKLVGVFERASESNERRKHNDALENDYLAAAGTRDRISYGISKRKYLREKRRRGAPDFDNSFITTVGYGNTQPE